MIKQFLQNNLLYGENHRKKEFFNSEFLLYDEGLILPDPYRIWILDISHWNKPPVDLKRMKEVYGLRGVVIKGCDGSIRSRYSADHVQSAIDADLPYGLYDWLYPNSKVSIDLQTNAWVAQAQEYAPTLGVFIDAEWTNYAGVPAYPNASDLRMAHDKVKSKYGKSATTYTAKGYADEFLLGFDWLREELWVASYGGSVPLMPTGARDHIFWQFTDHLDGKTLDPAGNFELDGSYFHGTEDEFVLRYGEVSPSPVGEVMLEGKIIVSKINIRQGPGTGYPDIGDLFLNDRVYGEIDFATGWFFFTKIIRATGITETMSAWCAVRDNGVTLMTTREVIVADIPTRTHFIETYSDGSVKVDGSPIP